MKDVPADQLGAEVAVMVRALSSGSFAPAFKANNQLIHRGVAANFAATSSPDGGAWEPRKEEGDGHRLLIDSTDLFQSAATDFGVGSFNEIGDREASTGVDPLEVAYAATQNFGDPERNIPAREFEDVDEGTKDQMVENIADCGISLIS